jgi:tetratricopeptide (TPR) repeat protein
MDRVITKTMAELYFRQGHYQEAYEIYTALAEKDPFDPEIEKRLKELESKLKSLPPPDFTTLLSVENRIRNLEKWLANLRKRRK